MTHRFRHQAFLLALVAALSMAACGGSPPRENAGAPTAAVPARAKPSGDVRLKPDDEPAQAPPEANHQTESIYFAAGKTVVDDADRQRLRQFAARLKEDPRLVISLVSHTDDQGSRSYNLALAEERLDAVVEILRAAGVPRRQIRRKNAGSGLAAGGCSTPACRQQMRRVEVSFGQ